MKIELVYDEAKNSYVLGNVEETPGKAELEKPIMSSVQGAFDKFAKFEVMKVPVGGVATGFGGAYLIDRLVGEQLGKLGDIGNVLAAAGVAWFGPKVFGENASKWISGILLYEIVKPYLMDALDKAWPSSNSEAATEQSTPSASNAGMGQNTAYRNLGVYQGVF